MKLVLLASLLFASACGGPGQNALANTPTYLKGLRESFDAVGIEGAEPALAALEKQFAAYTQTGFAVSIARCADAPGVPL